MSILSLQAMAKKVIKTAVRTQTDLFQDAATNDRICNSMGCSVIFGTIDTVLHELMQECEAHAAFTHEDARRTKIDYLVNHVHPNVIAANLSLLGKDSTLFQDVGVSRQFRNLVFQCEGISPDAYFDFLKLNTSAAHAQRRLDRIQQTKEALEWCYREACPQAVDPAEWKDHDFASRNRVGKYLGLTKYSSKLLRAQYLTERPTDHIQAAIRGSCERLEDRRSAKPRSFGTVKVGKSLYIPLDLLKTFLTKMKAMGYLLEGEHCHFCNNNCGFRVYDDDDEITYYSSLPFSMAYFGHQNASTAIAQHVLKQMIKEGTITDQVVSAHARPNPRVAVVETVQVVVAGINRKKKVERLFEVPEIDEAEAEKYRQECQRKAEEARLARQRAALRAQREKEKETKRVKAKKGAKRTHP